MTITDDVAPQPKKRTAQRFGVERLVMCKTLAELRADFETMARNCMFILDRNKKHGEYNSMPTFSLWAGYWECARLNKIIIGDDADFKNMHT